MPVVAVVAAVSTVSAGVALGGVIGGIMIAGGAMTALGAVTGNQDLMKIGALASMGAGIASWAGVGAAGAGAVAGDVAGAAAGDVAGAATGAAGGVTTSGLIEKATGGMASAAGDLGMAAPTIGGTAPGLINSASKLGSGLTDFGPDVTSSVLQGASTPAVSNLGYVAPVGSPSILNGGASMGAPAVSGSFGEKALGFMRENPEATKLGASLIGGASDSYSKQSMLDQQMGQRRAEIQQQIELEAQQRARYNASITGQRG